MKIIHGVFTNSTVRGMLEIDKLTKNEIVEKQYDTMGITYTVICESGNVYKLLNFTDHNKGLRLHYAHIDSECYTDKYHDEIINMVIKPCLTPIFKLYDNVDECKFENHIKYW